MEALLEGLQRQLQSNSITISSACTRLSTHLHQATTDDIKSLHFCLPALLSTVLYGGAGGQRSWLSRAASGEDYDAVCRLLSPDGPLFMVLLVHSHKAIYDVGGERLPLAVQRHLSKQQHLPVYKDRLVVVGDGAQLRLDMAEYFLFFLVSLLFVPKEPSMGSTAMTTANWVSALVGDGVTANGKRPVVVNDLLTLRSPGLLQCQFDSQSAAEVYFVLLDLYFKFVLPTANSSKSAYHLKLQQSSLTRLSEFWLTVSSDYLLDNMTNEYDLDAIIKKPVCRPAVPLVNLDRILAAQRLVEHMTVSTFTPSLNHPLQAIIEAALPRYRVALYRYLRIMVSVWPSDNTLCVLLEVWMTAVFPWRTVEERYLQDVSGEALVRQDFYLIHKLFDDILAVCADLLGSWTDLQEDRVDGAALAEQAGPVVAALLDCLLNLERILPALKACEAEADSSFNRTPTARQLHEQLAQREPLARFTHNLLFTETGKQRAALLAGLVDRCKQLVVRCKPLVVSDAANGDMVVWAADLVRELQSVFGFTQPVLPDSHVRHRTPPSGVSTGSPPYGNRLEAVKRMRPAGHRQKGELQVLVHLFGAISHKLEHMLGRHVDLRFLAVPGNLILTVIVVVVVVYAVKCLIFGF